MHNTLILILPLLLLIVLWVSLVLLRQAPLHSSTHFGFSVTLIILAGYALWILGQLSITGGFSGLAIYGWMIFCVPTGVITYLLAVFSFNQVRSMKSKSSKIIKDTKEY